MMLSKKGSFSLAVCLLVLLVTPSVFSSDNFKDRVLEKNQECLAISQVDDRQECLKELRQIISQNSRESQKEMRDIIKSNDAFKSAVKERNKVYENARGQTPRW